MDTHFDFARRQIIRMTVTEVEEFLKNPPVGFVVENLNSRVVVRSDEEQSLVLIDDFHCSRGNVSFHNSMGSAVKIHDLWQYTKLRKTLLSKKIYLLASLCEAGRLTGSRNQRPEKERTKVLRQYVVCVDGNDPYIRWQMEKGLDWTIASVAGESYRVKIDLTDAMQTWAQDNIHISKTANPNQKFCWMGAAVLVKYYSDALFDFPHWFGYSNRSFTLAMT